MAGEVRKVYVSAMNASVKYTAKCSISHRSISRIDVAVGAIATAFPNT
jgi:hypothetical protein